MSKRAYLSVGTNIGDRQAHLQAAVTALNKEPQIKVKAVSPIYETEPVGDVVQANFYNLAVALDVSLTPQALLDCCHRIETAQHRTRPIHWGPRTIDLDILYYDDESIHTLTLTVPHPEIPNRRFVLVPMLDVTSDDDSRHQQIKQLLKQTDDHHWVKLVDRSGVKV